MLEQPRDLAHSLYEQASYTTNGIDTARKGQSLSAAATGIATGALALFAGQSTEYFQGGLEDAAPLVATFLALGLASANELGGFCGRSDRKGLFQKTATGGISGASLGLGVWGALATLGVVDVVLLGGTTTAALALFGAGYGGLANRRGRKRHRPCGTKLPCDVWLCPVCRQLVAPTGRFKDRTLKWDILDVCEYLDASGLSWDFVKAIAFARYIPGQEASNTWDPLDFEHAARDEVLRGRFETLWRKFEPVAVPFTDSKGRPIIDQERLEERIASTLDKWDKYREDQAR